MKPAALAWVFSAVLLAGCSTERYQDGGFETSDIQARILTPSGAPAIAARVWLVRSNGDSAPATAIDSLWTDSSGKARFKTARGADRSRLGLDIQSGTMLAIATGSLMHSDSATVVLSRSVVVVADSGSLSPPLLFVPGSHFASLPSSDRKGAILMLPQGSWDVAISQPGSLRVQRGLLLGSTTDTISLPPLQGLPQGPDIDLDAFQIDSLPLAADASFPLPQTWTKRSGSLDSMEFLPLLVEDDTGFTSLTTRMKLGNEGTDTLAPQGAAGVISGFLPPVGAIAVQFRFLSDPTRDTGLLRQLSLLDSSGAGVELRLGVSPFLAADSVLSVVRKFDSLEFTAPPQTNSLLTTVTWYFVWNTKSIEILTPAGRIGRVLTSGSFHNFRLGIEARSLGIGRTSKVQISKVKLFKPS